MKLENFTIRHYIRHVRKQSKHIQHVHAFVFAAVITGAIAAVILYTDYGFWHETYRADDIVVTEAPFDPESPGESMFKFWQEAKERFGSIGDSEGSLLEGKEVYKKEE